MTTAVERRSVYARQRVFLVDDHPLVREWLANVINQQWDLTVCGESEGRESCLEGIEKKRPHVVVVDISLKDCSGFDLIAEIKQRSPQVEIIVLSMHSSPLYAKRALRAGASGYVVKSETTRRICKVFRYLGLGNPTRQIASTLGISIKTVQVHCANIREKLGIPGATELYGVAVRWNERHREEMG
jgi:DNA-binding NarL/FixJ family response regulator